MCACVSILPTGNKKQWRARSGDCAAQIFDLVFHSLSKSIGININILRPCCAPQKLRPGIKKNGTSGRERENKTECARWRESNEKRKKNNKDIL